MNRPEEKRAEGQSETAETLRRLRAAGREWAARPLAERLAVLHRIRRLLAVDARALARSVPAIGGRSEGDTLTAEVLPLLDGLAFLGRAAPGLLGERRLGWRGRPLWLSGHRARIRREPFGVVLILAPFNFPIFLAGAQAFQALAAGNAVAVKPAPGFGAPMEALAGAFVEAGGPAGLFEVLPDGHEIGAEAVAAGPDLVILTGAAATGRAVMQALAEGPTPLIAELSGCDALHVLEGADLDMAAAALAYGLRFNGGNVCIAPRRVFLPRGLLAPFRSRLEAHLAASRPLPVEARSRARAHALLSQAASAGAEVWPELPPDGAATLRPTVVIDPPAESALLGSDLFAPVASLIPLDAETERLNRHAECPYALGASIYGPEPEALRLAEALDAGFVSINDLIVPSADPRLPFGGRHQSGFGVTRGAEGLLAMTRPKAVTTRSGRFRPHYEPVDTDQQALVESYLALAHGTSGPARLPALFRFIGAIGRQPRRGRPKAGE